jgi:hypothetical protein
MLSKPSGGWTDISICDFKNRASYLTDVPFELADAFIHAKKSYQPACVRFDAEGWDYILIADCNEAHIIFRDECPVILNYDVTRNILANELIDDLENYSHDWIEWESYHDLTLQEEKYRTKQLNNKITELKLLYRNGV